MDLGSYYGGSVVSVGDLHISDVFKGRHKDYLVNCMTVLNKLDSRLEELSPTVVVFHGDLIGQSETNIKNREVFSWVCRLFKKWSEKYILISVRGNHDMKGYPDFQFLVDLGYIKTVPSGTGYFDWYKSEGDEIPEVRFHVVNYGMETEEIFIHENGEVSNVVFGHNDYTIKGVDPYYYSKGGVELNSRHNFIGVDVVLSGHIHCPSPDYMIATMPNNAPCSLFYVGCPTRPIKDGLKYNSVWLPTFVYDEGTGCSDIVMNSLELEDWDCLFYKDEEFITEDTNSQEEAERVAKLDDLVEELMGYRILSGDIVDQVRKIPYASEESKELAEKYLMTALNSGAS